MWLFFFLAFERCCCHCCCAAAVVVIAALVVVVVMQDPLHRRNADIRPKNNNRIGYVHLETFTLPSRIMSCRLLPSHIPIGCLRCFGLVCSSSSLLLTDITFNSCLSFLSRSFSYSFFAPSRHSFEHFVFANKHMASVYFVISPFACSLRLNSMVFRYQFFLSRCFARLFSVLPWRMRGTARERETEEAEKKNTTATHWIVSGISKYVRLRRGCGCIDAFHPIPIQYEMPFQSSIFIYTIRHSQWHQRDFFFSSEV